jgi:energy-converting hydrogenase Eha subunit F
MGMSKRINMTTTNSSHFKQMISKTIININYSSIFIWLAKVLSASAYLGLFMFSVNYSVKQRQLHPNPQPHQQQQLPIPLLQNQPFLPEIQNQLSQQNYKI